VKSKIFKVYVIGLTLITCWALVSVFTYVRKVDIIIKTFECLEICDGEVVGMADKPAMGSVLSVVINETDSMLIQQQLCINLGDVEIGDSFRAVFVYDDEGVLLSVTRIEN